MSLGVTSRTSGRIARRYARAFFDSACGNTALEDVWPDVQALRHALQQSPELQHFVKNPEISKAHRRSAITTLFKTRVHDQTLRFLLFLVRKDRLGLLPVILEAFKDLYHAHAGIVHLRIESALPVAPALAKSINASFGRRLDGRIESDTHINPALIGGIRVTAGDTVYDLSVRGLLDRFRRKVLGATLT